jgi:2-hydroxychromene-2-carboxylate isomerase
MSVGAGARLFCFDLASPLCYLAAERVLQIGAKGPLEWLPVSAGDLPAAGAKKAFRCAAEIGAFQEDIERQAHRLGLQRVRWPDPFPFESRTAMLAATYAKEIGRAVPFAQAAFRQAFAGGHALEREDFVLIAAAACEMHPRAVSGAIASGATAERLAAAGARAAAAGVEDLPAVLIDGQAICGRQALTWILERADADPRAEAPSALEAGRG